MLLCEFNAESLVLLALLAVGIGIAICSFIAVVARISVFFRYHSYNKKFVACGLSGREAARVLLDSKGMQDIDVKKAGWFRAFVWGNSYAPNKKTIYLRRGIIDKTSLTAVGLACQKVGLAQQHHTGDRKYKAYAKLVPYCPFMPYFFLIMVLVGVVLEALIFNFVGYALITTIIIGLIFYIASFVLTILNVPVEKKATKIALEIMDDTNILQPHEKLQMEKLYKSYIVQYVTEMIMAILYLIKYILKIVLAVMQKSKR